MAEPQPVMLFDAMTAAEARSCVDRIVRSMADAREALLALYERRGWVSLGYASWRECAVAEFGQSQRYLYRQLEAAETERQIWPMGQIGIIPERQLRPLTRLPAEERADVWAEAVATAPDGKVTAAHVAATVERLMQSEAADEESPDAGLPFTPEPEPEDEPDQWPEPARPSMAVHFASESPEWYTPPDILASVLLVLGEIDLDPCSNQGVPNVPALQHFTATEDGLAQAWGGRVYLNPPYGSGIGEWVQKLLAEYERERVTEAIALLPARTDTAWFAPLFDYPLCFVRGRLRFSGAENSAPFPSALVYLGDNGEQFIEVFRRVGAIVGRLD